MTADENAFAEELIAYWLSFVRSHDPNKFKLAHSPTWPAFTSAHPQRIVLQEGTTTARSESHAETVSDTEIGRCNFVASNVNRQQN